MLFNSFPFIFLFLPITLVVYFVLNRQRLTIAGKVWLAFASIGFYAYWNVRFVALLLASIGFNYVIGSVLRRMQRNTALKKVVLTSGIAFGLLVLTGFKCADFSIANFNSLLSTHVGALRLVLPA